MTSHALSEDDASSGLSRLHGAARFAGSAPELTTILFDLDGTLVDIRSRYFQLELTFMLRAIPRFARVMSPLRFRRAFWSAVRAMQSNTSEETNFELFARVLSHSASVREDVVKKVLLDCVEYDLRSLQRYFVPISGARNTLLEAQELGYRIVLATNPLWPERGVEFRLRWGGLGDIEFAYITHAQNSTRCKPQVAYYQRLIETLKVRPEQCIMVGNDPIKDLPAIDAGVDTFLMDLDSETHWHAETYGRGDFGDLRAFLRRSAKQRDAATRDSITVGRSEQPGENSMQPKLVCVAGPDGSGKTTQITRLASWFDSHAKNKAVAVTIWDLLLDPSCRGRLLFSSPKDVDQYMEILAPTARAHFLYHCFHQAMELASKRKADVLLVNSYWYKYYATEVAHGGDPELLRELAVGFRRPDLTFYLRVEPEQAFARKDGLSGYETGFAETRSEEAFVAFQRKALAVLDGLAEELGWVHLDGSSTVEALTEAMLGRIDSEVCVC